MDWSETRLRVLVVEDCRDTAETLRFLIDLWGHDVRVAHNGLTALGLAPVFQPDVVLIDIGLPGPDGFEVARRLRAQPTDNSSLLIAATGFADAAVRQTAYEAGFDQFLTKPFDLVLLRHLLSGARAAVPAS